MSDFVKFGIMGIGIGGLYALSAQGLVLVYRGSGVLNFAHGAIGISGAFVYYEIHILDGKTNALALPAGLAFAAGVGAAVHLLVMRPLRRASGLARLVATLGILLLLTALIVLRYGPQTEFVPSMLPARLWQPWPWLAIISDRVYILLVVGALTVALWALYRFTRFGLGTSAVTENERAAAALGWSPDLIAGANWALGSALAALAAILMSPIATLSVSRGTALVLASLAAALAGNFSSFPITLLAGLVIGFAETELNIYVDTPGLATSVPFYVILLLLVVRGRALPLRDFFLQRMPAVGSGRIRLLPLLPVVALVALGIARLSPIWADCLIAWLSTAALMLSVVVVTGYAGQISLAQYAIAGIGVLIALRLLVDAGLPFWAALLAGPLTAAPIGALFALPAVRTRGVNLAILTLGLGAAVQTVVFGNRFFTGIRLGGYDGDPTLLGWHVNSILHPQRYALVCFGGFVVAALAVANVRRGRSGRRLLAVRTNERAAAALGINVAAAKLYAFSLSAAIAALGGILIAFRNETIPLGDFGNENSPLLIALAAIGGIGYVLGPLAGAAFASGGLVAQIQGVDRYLPTIAALVLLALLLWSQDGFLRPISRFGTALGERIPGFGTRRAPALPTERRERVRPRTLEVRDLTVRFGAVVALDGVDLDVRPGEVVGLIGPNGAGKTTLVDAVSGFVRAARGTIALDGHSLSRRSAAYRARAGISRSFQGLELFEDMTVLENLRTAADPRDLRSYLTDVVYPVAPALPGEVVAAIEEFQLGDDLERRAEDLFYSERRLLAIARAVATQPSVLLLDEPAAGLSSAESAELAHLVRRLADEWGMAVLVIEHDVEFVMSVCDRIAVLDFGRKISEGAPEQVRGDPAVVAAYLGEPYEPEAAPA